MTANVAGAWLPGLGSGARPEPVAAERIPVPFAGDGAGRAPLTWGQRDIWATMIRQRNWLPLGGRRPLAPGTQVEDVAAELAYLHSRYPSLRTRLAFEPAEGEAGQRVSASGQTVLEIYDTPPGQDPDAVAASVEAVYRRRPYDLRAEWPVRMAVVRADGVCAHLVVIMHHLALDSGGAAVMLREVAVRETGEPVGMQPLDQAQWQGSEAGRRHNDRTLRYFERLLSTFRQESDSAVPTTPLAGPRRPRHWTGILTSPALAESVTTIAARTGVDESAVLAALVGVAFARVAGTGRVLIRPRVGNRFRPALADVVCFVAQSGLLVLNPTGLTFDEAVAQARGASMAAVKNAYFDPDALRELLDRSVPDRIEVFFNDRRSTPVVEQPSAATEPGERPTIRGRSTFTWLHRGPEPAEPLSVTLDSVDSVDSTDGGALAVSVHFDTHVIAPERAEELVWGIERAGLEAAADGAAATGV